MKFKFDRIVTSALLLVIAPLVHAAEASGASDEVADARTDAMVEEFMKNSDRNGDGVLTEDEVPGMFSLVDANRDGRAERAEVQALIARMGKPFSWVNPASADQALPGLTHSTFESPSMGIPVGYNIYLPPGYQDAANRSTRYPVVYYLHGGRPGNESLSIGLAEQVHAAITSGSVRPVIFVWGNGGKVSWYNYSDSEGDSNGEDVFVKQLIPHIDRTYRTIAHRGGRALQGFSQGGRGTTRIMFKYPELFISAAPGGPGYATEKQIFESDGIELDVRMGDQAVPLNFGKGNDAYSRAKDYARRPTQPLLNIMIWVGNKGFNYEATLEYLGFLYGLGIPVERLVAPDVDHNPFTFYGARGVELLQFHDRHWGNQFD